MKPSPSEVTVNGVNYLVFDSNGNCHKCALHESRADCMNAPCTPGQRRDNKNVIFLLTTDLRAQIRLLKERTT